jgi:hypothetical protein
MPSSVSHLTLLCMQVCAGLLRHAVWLLVYESTGSGWDAVNCWVLELSSQ